MFKLVLKKARRSKFYYSNALLEWDPKATLFFFPDVKHNFPYDFKINYCTQPAWDIPGFLPLLTDEELKAYELAATRQLMREFTFVKKTFDKPENPGVHDVLQVQSADLSAIIRERSALLSRHLDVKDPFSLRSLAKEKEKKTGKSKKNPNFRPAKTIEKIFVPDPQYAAEMNKIAEQAINKPIQLTYNYVYSPIKISVKLKGTDTPVTIIPKHTIPVDDVPDSWEDIVLPPPVRPAGGVPSIVRLPFIKRAFHTMDYSSRVSVIMRKQISTAIGKVVGKNKLIKEEPHKLLKALDLGGSGVQPSFDDSRTERISNACFSTVSVVEPQYLNPLVFEREINMGNKERREVKVRIHEDTVKGVAANCQDGYFNLRLELVRKNNRYLIRLNNLDPDKVECYEPVNPPNHFRIAGVSYKNPHGPAPFGYVGDSEAERQEFIDKLRASVPF